MPNVDGVNYPGPWEVRILYSTLSNGVSTNHVMRINVDVDTDPGPGSPFSDYDLISRAGVIPQLDTFVDDLVALLVPNYDDTSNFSVAELWRYTAGTFDAAFQSSYTIGEAGTSVAVTTQWAQAIITFRSTLGGSGRLTLMQPALLVNVTDAYPFAIANVNNLADFVVANASPFLARDGGYLFSPLNYMVGHNEAMFKRTNRP